MRGLQMVKAFFNKKSKIFDSTFSVLSLFGFREVSHIIRFAQNVYLIE